MNLFNLGSFHALVDYAHNPHSYEALGGFVRNWTTGDRIGVIGGPGDRRNEDFVALGTLSAEIFDRIIVKEDDDTRGRNRGDAATWIQLGITQAKPDAKHEAILDETTAIRTALDNAPPGSLVVILPESVTRAIQLIEERNPIQVIASSSESSSQRGDEKAEPSSIVSSAERSPDGEAVAEAEAVPTRSAV